MMEYIISKAKDNGLLEHLFLILYTYIEHAFEQQYMQQRTSVYISPYAKEKHTIVTHTTTSYLRKFAIQQNYRRAYIDAIVLHSEGINTIQTAYFTMFLALWIDHAEVKDIDPSEYIGNFRRLTPSNTGERFQFLIGRFLQVLELFIVEAVKLMCCKIKTLSTDYTIGIPMIERIASDYLDYTVFEPLFDPAKTKSGPMKELISNMVYMWSSKVASLAIRTYDHCVKEFSEIIAEIAPQFH